MYICRLISHCRILWQAGCEMKYVSELGGHVPIRDRNLKTTVDEIYVAGDAAGIEEASSAMVEGKLAGISAAISLGYDNENRKFKRRLYRTTKFP